MSKMLIKGGTIVNEGRSFQGDLLIDGEVISDIFEGMAPRGIYDEVVDATGCGDTYSAGYLYKRLQGANPVEAGKFAAAMCTIKLEHNGPFNRTIQDVERIMK